MRAAQRNDTQFAILFIDLDRFRTSTTRWAMPLATMPWSGCLARAKVLREVDTLCRVGGDEFVAYLHENRRRGG